MDLFDCRRLMSSHLHRVAVRNWLVSCFMLKGKKSKFTLSWLKSIQAPFKLAAQHVTGYKSLNFAIDRNQLAVITMWIMKYWKLEKKNGSIPEAKRLHLDAFHGNVSSAHVGVSVGCCIHFHKLAKHKLWRWDCKRLQSSHALICREIKDDFRRAHKTTKR